MQIYLLENWFTYDNPNSCFTLTGNVYGNKHHETGAYIKTSQIAACHFYRLQPGYIVPTMNSLYMLGQPYKPNKTKKERP